VEHRLNVVGQLIGIMVGIDPFPVQPAVVVVTQTGGVDARRQAWLLFGSCFNLMFLIPTLSSFL
jgi:hypothetical protein